MKRALALSLVLAAVLCAPAGAAVYLSDTVATNFADSAAAAAARSNPWATWSRGSCHRQSPWRFGCGIELASAARYCWRRYDLVLSVVTNRLRVENAGLWFCSTRR